MFSTFRVSLRRILSLLLLTTILFFGIGSLANTENAIAASSTRDVTVANMKDSISNSEYESAKVRRQQKQAQRSMAAKAKKNRNSENIDEKLNVDEEISESTQSFIDQITDD